MVMRTADASGAYTLALSVLVVAMAMMIASLAMPDFVLDHGLSAAELAALLTRLAQ